MKVTKKEKKDIRRIGLQKRNAFRIEEAILKATENGAEPFIFPVVEHFSTGVYCREVHMPAGTALTGVIHKIESFVVLAKGRLRVLWGDTAIDIEAPYLMKNVPGIKNAWYAFEDSVLFGVVPNPDELRDIKSVIGIFSETPADQVQGMGNNTQEKILERRINAQ